MNILRTSLSFILLAMVVAHCAAEAGRPLKPPNATLFSCADAPPCGTSMACYNGCCAYSNGPSDQCTGDSCNGDGSYGYQFQCVELAQRCFAKWFSIAPIWYDNANGMCGNYPSGVSHTSNPQPGDLMVFDWAPYGHVTVITSVSGSDISVIEQNSSPNGKNVYQRGSEQCFLTAGSAPPASMCGSVPDGWYCGGDMINGGKPDTLHFCSGGKVTQKKACSNGACAVVPSANDICVAGTCNSGNPAGWFCGNDDMTSAVSDVLYFCNGGAVPTTAKKCLNGCTVAAQGQNDYCSA